MPVTKPSKPYGKAENGDETDQGEATEKPPPRFRREGAAELDAGVAELQHLIARSP